MREFRAILTFFLPVRWKLTGAAVLAACAFVSAIGLIAVSGWLISRASQMPPVLTLSVAIVMVRAFGLGRAVFRYAERLLSHDAVMESLVELRVRLYEALVALPISRLVRMKRADVLSALVRDVDEVQYLPLRALVPAAGASIAAAVCVAVEFWIDAATGWWVLAGWLVSAIVLGCTAWAWARKSAGSVAEDSASLAGAAIDLIEGSADIAALGLSGQAMAAICDMDARLARAGTRYTSRASSVNALLVLVQGAMVVGIAWSMLPQITAGDVNPVLLASALFVPLAMAEVIGVYVSAALTVAAVEPCVQRLAALLGGASVDEGATEFHAWRRPLPAGLRIAAGEHVGLSGLSGAGKSTALQVLAGLLPELADGVDVAGWSPAVAAVADRGRLVTAYAEQQPQIFATSIAENLQVARSLGAEPLPPEQLWAVLDAVALGEWVRSLPDGLDSLVGIAGAKMSGGQQQRLALARLFIADPETWLVDEPTSHLDARTAERVLESLALATENRGLLIGSHEPRDLALCDRVIALGSIPVK